MNNEQKEILRGSIDGIHGTMLAGWFYSRRKNETNKLTLYVDDVKFKVVECNLPRKDVQEALGYGGNAGFMACLAELDESKVHKIKLVDEKSGFDFSGAELRYSRLVANLKSKFSDIFLADYYIANNRLYHLTEDQAFEHYMSIGVYAGYQPCPWISESYLLEMYPDLANNSNPAIAQYLQEESKLKLRASSSFDTPFYAARNKDLNTESGLLGHYVQFGRHEGRQTTNPNLPENIEKEILELSDIEPDINTLALKTNLKIRYSRIDSATYLSKYFADKYGDSIDAIICVPFVSVGGADLISTYVLKAYQEKYGIDKVLLLVTDSTVVQMSDWLPDGTIYEIIGNKISNLPENRQISSVHDVLARLSPKKIVNVNSHITWKTMKMYGRQLSQICDLHAYLFCFDYDEKGFRVGYISDYFKSTISYLKSVFVDNAKIKSDIEQLFNLNKLDANKINVVYVPANLPNGIKGGFDHLGNDVLWIGRLSEQKNPDLLVEVAKKLPYLKFDVYGPEGNSPKCNAIINNNYPNIRYKGVYSRIDEVDFTRYRLLLNTSKWEGLPTLLIQIMGIGLPVVSTLAGGISEILQNDTGWPVENDCDMDKIVKMALVRKSLSQHKAQKAKKFVLERHTWDNFQSAMEKALAFQEKDANVVPFQKIA